MANEPIDIFSQTEQGATPVTPPPALTGMGEVSSPGSVQQPTQPTPTPTAQQQALSAVEEQELFGQDKMSGKQIAIVVIVGVIVLAALGGGGYFVYRGITTSNTNQSTNTNTGVNTNQSTNVNTGVNRNQNTNSGNSNTNVIVPPVNTNTATNTNTQVNTNINTNVAPNTNTSSDPDEDGLSNQEETTYGTNPNVADTDNDGYLDGDEVENGYNPLGPGKL